MQKPTYTRESICKIAWRQANLSLDLDGHDLSYIDEEEASMLFLDKPESLDPRKVRFLTRSKALWFSIFDELNQPFSCFISSLSQANKSISVAVTGYSEVNNCWVVLLIDYVAVTKNLVEASASLMFGLMCDPTCIASVELQQSGLRELAESLQKISGVWR